jgi:hypothetical protein
MDKIPGLSDQAEGELVVPPDYPILLYQGMKKKTYVSAFQGEIVKKQVLGHIRQAIFLLVFILSS